MVSRGERVMVRGTELVGLAALTHKDYHGVILSKHRKALTIS